MKIGEYKAAKDQLDATRKRIAIEKRKKLSGETVFSPMKRLLANQNSPRGRATARATQRARALFAQV